MTREPASASSAHYIVSINKLEDSLIYGGNIEPRWFRISGRTDAASKSFYSRYVILFKKITNRLRLTHITRPTVPYTKKLRDTIPILLSITNFYMVSLRKMDSEEQKLFYLSAITLSAFFNSIYSIYRYLNRYPAI